MKVFKCSSCSTWPYESLFWFWLLGSPNSAVREKIENIRRGTLALLSGIQRRCCERPPIAQLIDLNDIMTENCFPIDLCH